MLGRPRNVSKPARQLDRVSTSSQSSSTQTTSPRLILFCVLQFRSCFLLCQVPLPAINRLVASKETRDRVWRVSFQCHIKSIAVNPTLTGRWRGFHHTPFMCITTGGSKLLTTGWSRYCVCGQLFWCKSALLFVS
jgi:hypothetical protein